jgi:hypothetical protein
VLHWPWLAYAESCRAVGRTGRKLPSLNGGTYMKKAKDRMLAITLAIIAIILVIKACGQI